MSYYDPNYNGIMNEGWICPRCGRVNAPWMPNCTCGRIKITYTKDTSTTAPAGKSYTINSSSYTSANIPNADELLRKGKAIKNWLESLSNYEIVRKDDYGME